MSQAFLDPEHQAPLRTLSLSMIARVSPAHPALKTLAAALGVDSYRVNLSDVQKPLQERTVGQPSAEVAV